MFFTSSWSKAEIVSREFYNHEISQNITQAHYINDIILIGLANRKQQVL